MSGAAMIGPLLVAAALGLPLLAAGLLLLRPGWGRWLLVVAPLPALAVVVLADPGAAVDLPWLLLGARFGLDDTGRVLLLGSAVAWLAAALYAVAGRGLRDTAARAGFLLALAGNVGIVLAQDAAGFFTCYALMSFAAYLLVVEPGDAGAHRAGRVYLVLVVLGEVLVLGGLAMALGPAMAADLAPPADRLPGGAAAVVLWLGFGIKAGLVPLHMSLPLAYGSASTPGAIALAGAMVNAGLLGWLRFLPAEPAGGLGVAMMGVGLAGAFYGVLVGLTQTSPKVLLGYSSVSQMGLLAVGVGAGLLVPAAWPALLGAVLLYAVHHGLAKTALFVGVDIAVRRPSRLALLGLAVPALVLVGLPFTSGAVAKAALKDTLLALPSPWPEVFALALPAAAVGTTLLMARLLVLAAVREAGPAATVPQRLIYAALLVGMLLHAGWPAAGLPLPVALPPVAAVDALWPGLAGAAIASAAWWAYGRGRLRLPLRIPPGDVLVALERPASRLWAAVAPAPEGHHHAEGGPPAAEVRRNAVAVRLAWVGGVLGRWEAAGLAALVAVLLVTGLLVLA